MPYVLGLDIGTTSTVGILIDPADPTFRKIISRPTTLNSPYQSWSEEDPNQWWQNVTEICQEIFRNGAINTNHIAAVGVSGMLPAVVLLDHNDNLIRPSIQQSDGRSSNEVQELLAEQNEKLFLSKTGNGINQQLVAAKLRWIEKHEPRNFDRIKTVFGSYDYINWKLTGKKMVEQNWALEAGFVNITTDAIDDELVDFAHIARAAVPPKSLSHQPMGNVSDEAARATGLPAGIPVIGGAADHIASAFAAGIHTPGKVLLKYGGATDILLSSDTVTPDSRMYLDYHLIPDLYMPNGCMASGGSGLNWFIQNFANAEMLKAQELGQTIHHYLDVLASDISPGAEGIIVLPYLLGEKTPIHDPNARGVFAGLSLNHGVAHLWRALLESFAYAIRHHIDVFNNMGYPTDTYFASDGGSNSQLWMQITADVLGKPIRLLKGHPGSSLGVAWLAAYGVGLTNTLEDVSKWITYHSVIKPNSDNILTYQQGYKRYHQLYSQLKPLFTEGQ